MSQEESRDDYLEAKERLRGRLNALNTTLDEYLAQDYQQADSTKAFAAWKASHQPFHWLAEFYDIVENNGGFDVVIGNPPYVEYAKVKRDYAIRGYATEECGNLYAFFVERGVLLGKETSGLILPISFPATPRMQALRSLLTDQRVNLHISNFADRPATLFNGVHQKLSILLSHPGNNQTIFTSGFLHWYTSEQEGLFSMLPYQKNTMLNALSVWAKIGTPLEIKIMEKVFAQNKPIMSHMKKGTGQFPFHLNMRLMFWVKCFLDSKESREFQTFHARSEKEGKALMAILNSTLFFWFWELVSDCWHLTKRELTDFMVNFDSLSSHDLTSLAKIGTELESDLEKKKEYVGTRQTDYEYYHKKSKSIIDEIDKILATHYGLTAEELDYIINYDIKYRMGLNQ